MPQRDLLIEHLLRRAGFGGTPDEIESYGELGFQAAVEALLEAGGAADVDAAIGQPGYVGVTFRGEFRPNTNITDARQRWLFRMVHTPTPLLEKMALFWHHHFATAYTKIAGVVGAADAARLMAAKPSEDPGRVRGQIELFRERALGNFGDLLLEVARDPAMLVWLDGRVNVKDKPQENFARELLELFTMGVGFYAEQDVYAGARVFTGWNLRRVGQRDDPASRYEFVYNARQHDTGAKTFSFPIYPDGGTTIPARPAADGVQDGVDLINAVTAHPETGRRLARRLYGFLVSELTDPPDEFVERVAGVYQSSGHDLRQLVRSILVSPEFTDGSSDFARHSWPAEFVVRAIRSVGWRGFSVGTAITPLANMGQQLFEPPDVNGWEVGRGWFTTGGMLARMNFAAALTGNQKFELRNEARADARTAQGLLRWALDRVGSMPFEAAPQGELLRYLVGPGNRWSGSDQDLLVKVPGVVHLILASSEYQFV